MNTSESPAAIGTGIDAAAWDQLHAEALHALMAIGADYLTAARAIGNVRRTTDQQRASAELADEPAPLCPGHPADEYGPMGETVYCDGRNAVERMSGGTIGSL